MKRKLLQALLICFILPTAPVIANPLADSTAKTQAPLPRFMIGSALDGLVFSTATITKGDRSKLGTLRFSAFFHFGFTFNYNFSRHFGVFSGIDLKNIGFIESGSTYSVKRRVYNLGVPVGIKVGNLSPGSTLLFLGGGVDAPVNYKQKTLATGIPKVKFNEWFSDRVPHIMPYVFAGISVHEITVKAQYYPTGFFNADYTDATGLKLYSDYKVNMLLLSFGFNTPFYKHRTAVKERTENKL